MKKIDNLNKDGSEFYTSIINFSKTARLIYNRVKPNQIDVNSIPFICGADTDFEGPFKLAYDIANNYIKQETIIFVFMTDGLASYPSKSIELLESLMNKYPNKFKYSGIEFKSDVREMKQISTAL